MRVSGDSGFSTIELVVVVALTGAIAAIALPNWNRFLKSYQLNNSTRQIQSEMHTLKSRAAAVNVNFQLIYAAGARGYTIQRDSIAMVTKPLAEGTTIAKAGKVSFSPRGTAAANRLRLLDDSQGACRQIVVSATGRVRSCTPNSCAEDC